MVADPDYDPLNDRDGGDDQQADSDEVSGGCVLLVLREFVFRQEIGCVGFELFFNLIANYSFFSRMTI